MRECKWSVLDVHPRAEQVVRRREHVPPATRLDEGEVAEVCVAVANEVVEDEQLEELAGLDGVRADVAEALDEQVEVATGLLAVPALGSGPQAGQGAGLYRPRVASAATRG